MLINSYKRLSVYDRAALIESLDRLSGTKNGEIQISVRQMVRAIDCGKNKAAQTFNKPQDKGWIKANKKVSFSWKTHTNNEASGSGRASTCF